MSQQRNELLSRTPPQNVELEMCLLGGIMLEPKEAYPLAAEVVTRDSFYLEGHSIVFDMMKDLYERGIPPDSVSVLDELRARSLLEKIGGSGVLMGMLNSVPTAANTVYYARKVQDKYRFRKMIRACTMAIEQCYMQETPLRDIMDGMHSFLARIGDDQPLSDVVPLWEVMQENWCRMAERELAIREAKESGKEVSRLIGLSTGFPTLDGLTRGLRKSTLWVVGAPTSHGKSAWMGTVLHHLAVDQGVPVAVFSTEMSAEGIADRMLACGTKHIVGNDLRGISTSRFDYPDLSDQEWSILTSSYQKAVTAPVQIISRPMNVKLMRRIIVGMMSQPEEIRPRLIILDYLQRLQRHPDIHAGASSAEKVAANVNAVFDMAIEFNVPVIALAQYSRAHQGWPKVTDFEGSSAIEKCADVVLFLHKLKDPVEVDGKVIEKLRKYYFCVGKNRDGNVGDPSDQYRSARVPAYYYPEITRFMEAYLGRNHEALPASNGLQPLYS